MSFGKMNANTVKKKKRKKKEKGLLESDVHASHSLCPYQKNLYVKQTSLLI